MNRERLWTKDFVTVTATNFLLCFVFYSLMATIAIYTINRFDASTGNAGLVSGIFLIGILVGRLMTGHIIEDTGSKKILIFGTLFSSIMSALYLSATSLTLLIAVRFLHGLCHGSASTATGTMVAQLMPAHRRGEGIGYYSWSQIVANALGPFLGIVLSRHLGVKVIFIIASLIAAIAFLASLFIKEPWRNKTIQKEREAPEKFHISNIIEPTAIPISIIVMIIGFNYSTVLTFISLYGKELQLEKAASFFFIVYATVVMLSRPASGRLLDIKGANFVVYPCLFLFASGMVLLSKISNQASLLLSAVVIGLGYGNFLSCGYAIAIKDVPLNKVGLATATYWIFLDIGFGIGPYLFGSLLPFTGYSGLYMVMALLTLATIPLYHFVSSNK